MEAVEQDTINIGLHHRQDGASALQLFTAMPFKESGAVQLCHAVQMVDKLKLYANWTTDVARLIYG